MPCSIPSFDAANVQDDEIKIVNANIFSFLPSGQK